MLIIGPPDKQKSVAQFGNKLMVVYEHPVVVPNKILKLTYYIPRSDSYDD